MKKDDIKFFLTMCKIVIKNVILLTKYPFLKIDEYGKKKNKIILTTTELDGMPEGWRKAFGEQMCKEIKSSMTKKELKNYKVLQIKEKFGGLRWYDSCGSRSVTSGIIEKYEKISFSTCVICGKPHSRFITTGWMSPYCKECWERIEEKRQITRTTPIKYEDFDIYE